MKKNIHPELKDIIFKDAASDFSVLTKSTIQNTKETMKWEDGKDYPMVTLEVSSSSHPFYTGQQRLVDIEGRADKFRKKYARKTKK